MLSSILVPQHYFRGAGVLTEIGGICKTLADKVLLVGGQKALQAVQTEVINSLHKAEVTITGIEWYGGECTWENINKISEVAGEQEAELIIAVGGGKALDTGKAAAYKNNIPCITIPTIAATCASFTPLSIIHDAQGVYKENSPNSACPKAVFADSEIISQAPAKWLLCGMGDTLAKWYELRATTSLVAKTSWTVGGVRNGHICYEIIKEFGAQAKDAMAKQKASPAFEYVVDAIIFYAGMCSILGGDKFRGAAAHSIYMGFTSIPAAHDFGHGLLVGFGNLCLQALENRSEEEISQEIQLARECGIPTKLADIAELSDADVRKVAEFAIRTNGIRNMPMQVTPDMIVHSIKIIDRLGRATSC